MTRNPKARSKTRPALMRCPECRGSVRPHAAAGRRMTYKNVAGLKVPATLEIPTCDRCGAQWVNDTEAAAIDAAMMPVYHARARELRELFVDGLEGFAGFEETFRSHPDREGPMSHPLMADFMRYLFEVYQKARSDEAQRATLHRALAYVEHAFTEGGSWTRELIAVSFLENFWQAKELGIYEELKALLGQNMHDWLVKHFE